MHNSKGVVGCKHYRGWSGKSGRGPDIRQCDAGTPNDISVSYPTSSQDLDREDT